MNKYQKVVYDGKLSHYQKYGTSFKKIQFEKDPFNGSMLATFVESKC
jgi:hypothetical protein